MPVVREGFVSCLPVSRSQQSFKKTSLCQGQCDETGAVRWSYIAERELGCLKNNVGREGFFVKSNDGLIRLWDFSYTPIEEEFHVCCRLLQFEGE